MHAARWGGAFYIFYCMYTFRLAHAHTTHYTRSIHTQCMGILAWPPAPGASKPGGRSGSKPVYVSPTIGRRLQHQPSCLPPRLVLCSATVRGDAIKLVAKEPLSHTTRPSRSRNACCHSLLIPLIPLIHRVPCGVCVCIVWAPCEHIRIKYQRVGKNQLISPLFLEYVLVVPPLAISILVYAV